jgi:FtsP/CotA-like multicopper oxidase with cupredoxin domain
MVAGRTYRLRLINMAMNRSGARIELARDTTVLQWRELAKDGAPLPPARRAIKVASRGLTIGETMDVEVTPEVPGDLRLDVVFSRRRIVPRRLLATLPIRVRPATTVGRR